MENPATWGKIRHVIADTIAKFHELGRKGFVGASLPTMIYNELHNRGWLVADSKDLEESFKVTQ